MKWVTQPSLNLSARAIQINPPMFDRQASRDKALRDSLAHLEDIEQLYAKFHILAVFRCGF